MSIPDKQQDNHINLIDDPTYRIGRLPSANTAPERVSPAAPLEEIITKMMEKDFSQLPVMTSSRDLKGVVSWKTIGCRLALKQVCKVAADCIEEAHVCRQDESLLSAIELIAKHDFVLVQRADRTICGIVTPADLNVEFKTLTEGFLLVEEIEVGIRCLLDGKFSIEELQAIRGANESGRRPIDNISDLSFGEYVRLIERGNNWMKIKIAIDRSEFVKLLRDICDIRNKLMHFRSKGLSQTDHRRLLEAAGFLRRLRKAGVR